MKNCGMWLLTANMPQFVFMKSNPQSAMADSKASFIIVRNES